MDNIGQKICDKKYVLLLVFTVTPSKKNRNHLLKADYYKCYKRLFNKQYFQVSGLNDIPLLSYLPKQFTQIYRAQYGDAMLVSIRMVTNMAAGHQRKHLALTSATVEPRYNDPRYHDIPGITMNILCPCKSYSKMYETEPRYNDLRYNHIPDITMRIQRTEGKIFPDITKSSVHSHNLNKTLNIKQKSSNL